MELFLLIAWAPFVVGCLAALVVRFATRRRAVALTGRLGVLAVIAGLVPVAVAGWYASTGLDPGIFLVLGPAAYSAVQDARFAAPLAAGILSVIILSIPGPRRHRTPAGEIARRTAFTFLRRGWLLAFAVVAAVTVVVTCAAGLLSNSDPTGEGDMFGFPIGTSTVATTIYGWHSSGPALALLAILMLACWAALGVIARPPLAEDRDRDTAIRRTRCRNIAAVATGAVALHLAVILQSLAGTATLTGTVPSATAGDITVHSPFAALGPVLQAGSLLSICLAVTACVTVTLTAVPVMTRARASVESAP